MPDNTDVKYWICTLRKKICSKSGSVILQIFEGNPLLFPSFAVDGQLIGRLSTIDAFIIASPQTPLSSCTASHTLLCFL